MTKTFSNIFCVNSRIIYYSLELVNYSHLQWCNNGGKLVAIHHNKIFCAVREMIVSIVNFILFIYLFCWSAGLTDVELL